MRAAASPTPSRTQLQETSWTYRHFLVEESLQRQVHAAKHLGQEECVCALVQDTC